MSRKEPTRRRWLALELLNWARYDQANRHERVSRWGHASLVGWIVAAAELTEDEKAIVRKALEPDDLTPDEAQRMAGHI